MTRTQIQLPDELYQRAKAFAAQRELSKTVHVADLVDLNQYIGVLAAEDRQDARQHAGDRAVDGKQSN